MTFTSGMTLAEPGMPWHESPTLDEEGLRSILRALPIPVSVRDSEGRYVWINGAAAEAIGQSAEAVVGRSMEEVFPGDPRVGPCLEADRRFLRSGRGEELDPEVEGPLGDRQRVRLHGGRLVASFGGVEALSFEGRFAQAFRQLVEHANDVLYRVDVEGRIVYANPIAGQLLGYSGRELRSMQIFDIVREDYREQARLFYREQLANRTANTFLELPVVGRDGRERWLAQNVQLLLDGASPVAFQAVAREITDRKELEVQLSRLATHDSLTQLLNRSFFESELDLRIAQCVRDGSPGAVVLIDLDAFKAINDSFGHAAGDTFLQEFGGFLLSQFRESDIVCRLGGDEFGVMLLRSDREVVETLSSRLVTAARRFVVESAKGTLSTTVSVGVALFAEHGWTREGLLARADLALYQAKQLGRDRHQVFADGSAAGSAVETRSSWVDRLRQALERRDFVLYAQPVRDLRGGSVVYYETLLRLRHPDGKVVDSGAFMELADHLGLTVELDRWTVGAVIDALAEARHSRVVLGVNLSGEAVGSTSFMRWIRARLRETGVAASQLVFEITSDAAVDSLPGGRERVMSLAALGARFALDDFGAGFSSLHRLRKLPVDYLKIDGLFIRNIGRDRADRALLRAMVEVARALGRDTIAELVEDEETLRLLRRLGVDHGQGSHLGRCQPMAEVLSDGRAGRAEPRSP